MFLWLRQLSSSVEDLVLGIIMATKYGIKIWAMANSFNGYVSNFEVYAEKPSGEGG